MVEHQSAECEGLRFNSSWRLRMFSLSYTRNKTKHIPVLPYLPYLVMTMLRVPNNNTDISHNKPQQLWRKLGGWRLDVICDCKKTWLLIWTHNKILSSFWVFVYLLFHKTVLLEVRVSKVKLNLFMGKQRFQLKSIAHNQLMHILKTVFLHSDDFV